MAIRMTTRILTVNASTIIRASLVKALRNAGFDVDFDSDSGGGVGAPSEADPHSIITDIGMLHKVYVPKMELPALPSTEVRRHFGMCGPRMRSDGRVFDVVFLPQPVCPPQCR